MAKDYAKRVFTTSRPSKKRRWPAGFFIIPIALLIVVVTVYLVFHHKTEVFLTESSWLSRAKTLFLHKKIAEKTSAISVKTADNSKDQEQEVHFDFYTELPKMQVAISDEAVTSPPAAVSPQKITAKLHDPEAPVNQSIVNGAKKAASTPHAYIVQLGIFEDESSADQLRLTLLLADCEAEITKIHLDDQEMYRVQRGPFANEAEAKKIQRELQAKGIASSIKKA